MARYPYHFTANATLSYRAINCTRRFGVMLSPVHYRRRIPRPVRYYALFK